MGDMSFYPPPTSMPGTPSEPPLYHVFHERGLRCLPCRAMSQLFRNLLIIRILPARIGLASRTLAFPHKLSPIYLWVFFRCSQVALSMRLRLQGLCPWQRAHRGRALDTPGADSPAGQGPALKRLFSALGSAAAQLSQFHCLQVENIRMDISKVSISPVFCHPVWFCINSALCFIKHFHNHPKR